MGALNSGRERGVLHIDLGEPTVATQYNILIVTWEI
jgi:hypothetical protein